MIKNKVKSLSSYKAYLLFERDKREFENTLKKNLNLRKIDLKLEKKLQKQQDKAYLLDFLSNIQFIEPEKTIVKSQKMSNPEKAFLSYQKKQQAFQRDRKQAFLNYKNEYKNYQKRQKQILSLRLKAISGLRDKKEDSKIPIF